MKIRITELFGIEHPIIQGGSAARLARIRDALPGSRRDLPTVGPRGREAIRLISVRRTGEVSTVPACIICAEHKGEL